MKSIPTSFLGLITGLLAIGLVVRPFPAAAALFGFLLAGYSAIANDSIQTIGTFLGSNRQRPWWVLWLWLAAILVGTLAWGWMANDGDASFGRLATKGFESSPAEFSIFQILAPIVLLILTRFRVPVSTSFLLLSCFATSRGGIEKMFLKSLSGYGAAFLTALLVWGVVLRKMSGKVPPQQRPRWTVLQWLSTGALWAGWLMQDAANIVVYLPRTIDGGSMILVVAFLTGVLALLVYRRGGEIQDVIREKSGTEDLRTATLIDAILALVLFGYTAASTVPMSTTWAFLGLLAGREIGRKLGRHATEEGLGLGSALRLARKDLLRAGLGLALSLLLAALANPRLFQG